MTEFLKVRRENTALVRCSACSNTTRPQTQASMTWAHVASSLVGYWQRRSGAALWRRATAANVVRPSRVHGDESVPRIWNAERRQWRATDPRERGDPAWPRSPPRCRRTGPRELGVSALMLHRTGPVPRFRRAAPKPPPFPHAHVALPLRSHVSNLRIRYIFC